MLQDEENILGSGFMNAGPSASFNAPIPTFDINPWGGGFTAADPAAEDEGLAAASILVGIDLPEIYDTAYLRAAPMGDRVGVSNLEKILHLGGVPFQTLAQIKALVVMPGSVYVTRNEFNAALALIACAQKNMGTSLDTVRQHRNDLPVPILSNLDRFQIQRQVISEKQEDQLNDPWHQPPPELPSLPVGLNGQTTGNIKARGTASKSPGAIKAAIESQTWFQNIDPISISVAAKKEGFIFKHVNYIVQSQQRASTVLRRFSDFYWLWETLLMRYPCRLIPNMPPKRLGGRDDTFLEKRRKGLARFINSIVGHPVVRADEVVQQFLTEPSEFSIWRKENPPCTDEEFVRNLSNIDGEPALSTDLDSRLEKLKKKLPALIQNHQSMCITMERMVRIEEHRAADLVRYSTSLNLRKDSDSAMSELKRPCYVADCQPCEQVVSGCESVAGSMQHGSKILEDWAKATSVGVLDNLMRHRDLFVSFQEMMERMEKMPSAAKNRDGENAALQQKRKLYMQYCAASELSYLHKQQALISSWYQTYVQEQLRYERQQSENWKTLEVIVQDMPMEPDEFA
ncbi:Sorting nexin mvp1 [Apophysomyces sp. BC1021]|nr:Sorting nexin mvp1 [Apophysomyces sp. BC1021]